VKQGLGQQRIETAANGEIEVIEGAKVAVGSDMAFELPPDFFDGIEAMAAVGGQRYTLWRRRLSASHLNRARLQWILQLSAMT